MIPVPPSVKITDEELVELGDRMASRIEQLRESTVHKLRLRAESRCCGPCRDWSHMTTGHYDEGMAVRREVLGDSYVEQASAKTTDFTPAVNAAFRVALRVLDELEQQPDPTT